MPIIPLPTQSFSETAPDNINTKLLNCYAVPAPPGAVAPFIVESCAGLKTFSSGGTGPVRGLDQLGDFAYSVSGAEIYKVDSTGTAVLHGTIPNGGIVAMAVGFSFIIVLDGSGDAYLVDSTGVSFVTTIPFQAADVVFWNGFFVFARTGTNGEFFVSLQTPNSGEQISFDALDFQTAEIDSDDIVGLVTSRDNLWVIGSKTVQVYGNISGFPFTSIDGLFFKVGCAARDTIIEADQQVYWLGNDGAIYRSGQRVSSLDVEKSISLSTNRSQSFAYTFKEYGVEFVAFTFSNVTWIFDVKNDTWHERETINSDTWQPNVSLRAFGKQLIGDGLTGTIAELDPETEEYLGTTRRVVIRVPFVHAEGQSFRASYLDIKANGGAGTLTVKNPVIMMRYSKDGGRTWSTEQTRPLGKRGEYRRPIRFNNLGRAEDLLIELSVSDAVSVQIISLFLGITLGRRT